MWIHLQYWVHPHCSMKKVFLLLFFFMFQSAVQTVTIFKQLVWNLAALCSDHLWLGQMWGMGIWKLNLFKWKKWPQLIVFCGSGRTGQTEENIMEMLQIFISVVLICKVCLATIWLLLCFSLSTVFLTHFSLAGFTARNQTQQTLS